MSNAAIVSIYATPTLKLFPQIFTVHASEIAGSKTPGSTDFKHYAALVWLKSVYI